MFTKRKKSKILLLKDKMVLKMKNFNILGVHLTFKGGRRGFMKNQYRGERLPKKGGLDCLLI